MFKKLMIFFILLLISTVAFAQSYSFEYQTPLHSIFSGAASGQPETEHINIENTGTATDTYLIKTIIDEGPSNLVTFCYQGTCVGPEGSLTLEAGESNYLYATIYPNASGVVKFHFEISSPNIDTITIPFTYITNDIDLLLADADGDAAQVNSVEQVLQHMDNITWASWNTSVCIPTSTDLFHNVIYSAGNSTLETASTAWLKSLLDNNKNVIILGNNIANNLHAQNNVFLGDYLHSNFIQTTAYSQINGISNNPISNNVNINLANVNHDVINPTTGASAIFDISGIQNNAGVMFDNSYKMAFYSFDFENISSWNEKTNFIAKNLSWLNISYVGTSNNTNPYVSSLKLNNYPNPFNPSTKIKYDLGNSKTGDIFIFNVKGQRVNAFKVNSSKGDITWNGKSFSGKKLSSGIYFYKLKTKSKSITKRMLMLK